MKFPPDLIARVRGSIDRTGYCFLNSDEIRRLLAGVPASQQSRHEALQVFAVVCGARVETTTHLKSARFVRAEAPARDTTPLDDGFNRPAMA